MGHKARPTRGSEPGLEHAVLLSSDQAKSQLELEKYIHAWDDVRFVDGDVSIKGDLVMDEVPGLFVSGNLTVSGDVVNHEGDFGPPLIVLGNLKARNLVGGGSEFVVCGTTTVRNTIYGHYNHGGIELRGDVTAKVVLSDDHGIFLGGRVNAVTVDVRHNLSRPDFSPNDYQRAMAKGLIVDEWLDHERMLDRILVQNKSPLKGGVKPSRVIVEAEIAAAVADGRAIRELDLSDKNLHEVPEVLTELASIEVLDLSDNEISQLPESIAKLSKLRVLRHRGYGLERLPASFTQLASLEELDLRYSNVALPDDIDRLENLRILTIAAVPGPWPEAIGRLPRLEVLMAGGSTACRQTAFPEFVTRLPSLRVLDVSGHPFPSIPQSITNLASLESLDLTGSLMYLDDLPDLAPLGLKTLGFDGHSPHTGDKMPSAALLPKIFHLDTLESLNISRWGAKDEGHRVRGPLELPADVFARMPRLRRLDLAFNDLPALPESLYACDAIEFLDLRYNKLSDAERSRLGSRFPNAEFRW